VAILAAPVVPTAAGKLLDGLGQGPAARTFRSLGEAGRLRPGTAIPPPVGVFPRYVNPEDAIEPDAKPKPKVPKPKRR
jgi:methionyl-tRNA synthetase